MKKKITVLVVDDSALIRTLLTEILQADPGIEVVGTASDPLFARDKIKQLNPDVITLDIEMPRMDGVSFLRNLMRLRPMPVIMISTLTEAGADITLECLEIGAVDIVAKPKIDIKQGLKEYSERLVEKVYVAAEAKVHSFDERTVRNKPGNKNLALAKRRNNYILAIGASTGGTEAIKEVVMQLPLDGPPVVIAQHIPKEFCTSFVHRLEGCCDVRVFEAAHGQAIEEGCVYIAPGDKHLRLIKTADGFQCNLSDGALVNRHKPSVEVLFDSVTEVCNGNAAFALLTGMGADGSKALLRARRSGCFTVAQDEDSSVVWGMPGVAVGLGAACSVLPLHRIANNLLEQAYH